MASILNFKSRLKQGATLRNHCEIIILSTKSKIGEIERPSCKLSVQNVYKHIFSYTVRGILKVVFFLAHLSTTCSRGAFRVVLCLSSVVRLASSKISLNIFSSQTAGPI